MITTRDAALALRLLAAEGPQALRDRLRDRRLDARRRASFRPASPATLRALGPPAVLHTLSTAPLRRLGGLPQQLLARLDAASRERTVALLYPAGGRWRLEAWRAAERWALELPEGDSGAPLAPRSPGFEAAVRAACDLLDTRAVQVEGTSGVALASLLRLGEELRLILAVHDFSLFCPRPHLLEQPSDTFCDYSLDAARCLACLRVDWPVTSDFQGQRRAVAGRLLGAAAASLFASPFLLREHARLFPQVERGGWRVIAPALAPPTDLPPAARPRGSHRHVALVGGVKPHKGARVFLDLVERAGDSIGGRPLRWSAYGGGDLPLLRELRRAGVRVRGYYAAGSLPRLLRHDAVDLALLLSIVPESHCLALDECVAAGVPVLGFDHGALAERVPELAAGALVAPGLGVQGLIERLGAGLAAPTTGPRRGNARTPSDAAAEERQLHRDLGLEREAER